jgi:tetratricopeptide (TPR) repeat protein
MVKKLAGEEQAALGFGRLEKIKNNCDQAIHYFSVFINFENGRVSPVTPDLEYALINRAACYESLNQLEAANKDYIVLIEVSDNSDFMYRLAHNYYELGPDYYTKALNVIDQALEKHGMWPHLQRLAVQVLSAEGKWAEAFERHKSLSDVLGGTPQYELEYAHLCIKNNKLDQAKTHYHALIQTLESNNRNNKASLAVLKQAREAYSKLTNPGAPHE